MSDYTPPKDKWQHKAPQEAGFRPDAFDDALQFAATEEIGWSHDLTRYLPNGTRHPFDRILGPIKNRSGPAGLVMRHGFIIGEYGDPSSDEVTFSATKSYISAVAGLAVDRRLIGSVDDRVSAYVSDGGFESEHNATITWRHLLQQTSEWEGELFGIPDWIDRGRQVGTTSGSATSGTTTSGTTASSATTSGTTASNRTKTAPMVAVANNPERRLHPPGDFWEYNDVRVNRTALALLRLLREPLPQFLKRELMDPIGASDNWHWHGYENSWVDVDGDKMQSVSGGAHWGGGLWIDCFDHARFGLLFLRRGLWNTKRILSEDWVDSMTEPCTMNPHYGFLWWLNHEASIANNCSARSFAARGAGGNVVFIEPELDLVIVLRWCADAKKVIDRIVESLAS